MKYNPDIIKSNRKTIQLELRADGKLVVRAPKRMSYRDIEAYVNSNEQWIDRALSKHRSLYGDPLPPYPEKELEEFTATKLAQTDKSSLMEAEEKKPVRGRKKKAENA